MANMLTEKEFKAYIVALILCISVLLLMVLSIWLGYELIKCQNSESVEPLSTGSYCERPIPPDCKACEEEMKQWIKHSDKQRDRWHQCTLDLARCQNESNADIICIEPECK